MNHSVDDSPPFGKEIMAAREHYNNSRFEEAIAICETILNQDNHHHEALYIAGSIAAQAGQTDIAVELLERSVASEPKIAAYFIALANTYLSCNRYGDALAACQTALRIDPDSSEAKASMLELQSLHSAAASQPAHSVRKELAQDMHVFYVTAWGYAADHWYGWLPKALNCHPEIFALLAHEGSRPKYMKERTRGERPPLIPFTNFLNDMGMTYQAIGDCYFYRASQMPEVFSQWGDDIPIVNIVRHPYVWLEFYIRWRASNMRMPDGSMGPLEWEWGTVNHQYFESLGLKAYTKEDIPVWAAYQGMSQLNNVLSDQVADVRQFTLESIAASRDVFIDLVGYLTKGRCEYPPELLDLVYSFINTPFRGEEKLRMVPAEIYRSWPDWKREAFELIVSRDAVKCFEGFGYKF
jgi:hypothetical protein